MPEPGPAPKPERGHKSFTIPDKIPDDILAVLRPGSGREYQALPIGTKDGKLLIAVENPDDLVTDTIKFAILDSQKRDVVFVKVDRESLQAAIEQCYPVAGPAESLQETLRV